MKKLIVVADWANDAVLNQEVRTTVEGFSNEPHLVRIFYTPTTSSTIHTGYTLAHLVEIEERFGRPLETVFFVGTGPSHFANPKTGVSELSQFVIVRLFSGIYICGMNGLYNFSFIKEKIEEVYQYKTTDEQTRESYLRICAHLLQAEQDNLDLDEVSPIILPIETNYIGHIDVYGNLKTSIHKEYLKGKYVVNEQIPIKINNKTQSVRFVESLEKGPENELLIGLSDFGPKDNPYLEIGMWNTDGKNSIQELFNNPKPGDEIKIG